MSRETILRFSRPLAPETIGDAAIRAEFGGEVLATRLHVSPDRRRVTLFYLEPLPAAARVRVTVDGAELLDEDGVAVDAHGRAPPPCQELDGQGAFLMSRRLQSRA